LTKLYCYIDETGQDTEGRFFVVVAIVTTQREQIAGALEAAEDTSRKGKRKWHHSNERRRLAYIEAALTPTLSGHIFYEVYDGPVAFELVTMTTAARAITAYRRRRHIEEYKATVVIDGMPRSLQNRAAKHLRDLGIRTQAVRGERDEVNPFIRLADAVAGIIREAEEGSSRYKTMKAQLEQQGIIVEV